MGLMEIPPLINMKLFNRLTTVLVIIFCSCCQEKLKNILKQKLSPPNILWLVGENFKLDFGCYGANNVFTSHIDSLAEHGMKFTRVFSTSPVCAPAGPRL